MNDLRLASVRVVQSGEHISDDADLLVVSERQATLLDVLTKSLPCHVFGDEGEPVPRVLVVEELANRKDVGVTGQVRQRAEGIADQLHLPLALLVGQVGVDLIDAKTRGAAATRTEQRVPCADTRCSDRFRRAFPRPASCRSTGGALFGFARPTMDFIDLAKLRSDVRRERLPGRGTCPGRTPRTSSGTRPMDHPGRPRLERGRPAAVMSTAAST